MVLDLRDICKSYMQGKEPVPVLHHIQLQVEEGEYLAIMGPSGSGKSTLMNILFGMSVIRETGGYEGEIIFEGKTVKVQSPEDAMALGIGMVHQHFMLLPSLTVAENVVLGIEPMKNGFFDFKKAVEMTREVAEKYKFDIDPLMKVADLSVGQMQKVEIMKVLIKGAKIIIMDEPTAVLTPQETEELFEQLILLRENGHSIIFISHKLEEVKRICTRVTVLRHGYCLGSYDLKDMNEADISRLMVGRDVILKIEKEAPSVGKTIISIKNLVKVNESGKTVLDDISLNIREGEVVGIAGVEGNGQSDLSDVLSGMGGFTSGTVELNGNSIAGKTVHEIRQMGLAYIPEDRMEYGCAGDMSIRDNIIADRYFKKEYRSGFFVNRKYIDKIVDQYIKDFEIACDDKNQPVRMLSGGNIQKVVVAREFTSGSNFILANQPTRGIDAGARTDVYNIIKGLSKKGLAVLLISSDMEEIIELSDRAVTIHQGRLNCEFDRADINQENLTKASFGVIGKEKES